MARFAPIELRRGRLSFDRPLIFGVINVTPDSFSDGGALSTLPSAVEFALRLVAAGADVLDIGGESTRPKGARQVEADEEIARVVPLIAALARATEAPISVDTTKAAVAEAALEAGAEIVNDISGGLFDAAIVDLCARRAAAYVLGHVRGRSVAEVHAAEEAPPGFDEVAAELAARLFELPVNLRQRTVVDPGIGFGKRRAQNLELLARAGELGARLGRPVMVGPSRKRFLSELFDGGRDVATRDDATVGACLAAVAAGADVLRVHDVRRVHDALVAFEAVRRGPGDRAHGREDATLERGAAERPGAPDARALAEVK